MEHLTFDYPARRPATARAHVGVVGSGDLEVLLSPSDAMAAHVIVRTSVDGYAHIWKHVLDRFFTRYDGAATIEINDFGATPGVVALRLAEAAEESEQGAGQ
jgi:malonate decarboxylase delta subunit